MQKILFYVSACILFCTLSCSANAANRDCSVQPRISIGGVTGFASLADPRATTLLRQSCQVGLYIHAEGWKAVDDNAKAQILSNFQGTGPAVIELGWVDTPNGYFKNFYKPVFLDKGVKADTALINGLCNGGTEGAISYVNMAKQYGLSTVAVVFAPNSGQFKTSNFSDPRWDCVRVAAQAGGALAIDAPPHVFFALKAPYQQFVIDEIRWANAHNIASYYIVSPNGSRDQFGYEAEQLVDTLTAAHAVPAKYIFETYDIQRTDAANQVGVEQDSKTVAGVALQLLPKVTQR